MIDFVWKHHKQERQEASCSCRERGVERQQQQQAGKVEEEERERQLCVLESLGEDEKKKSGKEGHGKKMNEMFLIIHVAKHMALSNQRTQPRLKACD